MEQNTAVKYDGNARTEELIFHGMKDDGSVKQAYSVPCPKLNDGLIFFLGRRKVEGFKDEEHIYIQETKDGIDPAQWEKPADGITLSRGKIPYLLVERTGFDHLRDYLEKKFSDEGYNTCFELKEIRDSDGGNLIALRIIEKQRNVHYRHNDHI